MSEAMVLARNALPALVAKKFSISKRKSSFIKEATDFYRTQEHKVLSSWDSLSPQDQAELQRVVYLILEPNVKIRLLARLIAFPLSFFFEKTGAVRELAQAAEGFVEAVLERAEQEHPQYETTVTSRVNRAVEDHRSYPAMTAREASERLRSISRGVRAEF